MADAEKLLSQDRLRDAYPKINDAIDNANSAKTNSDNAVNTANEAKAQSEGTQTQLDNVLIEGDSSVEAAAARVDTDGDNHPTLKDRLDSEHSAVTAQLADIESKQGVIPALDTNPTDPSIGQMWILNQAVKETMDLTIVPTTTGEVTVSDRKGYAYEFPNNSFYFENSPNLSVEITLQDVFRTSQIISIGYIMPDTTILEVQIYGKTSVDNYLFRLYSQSYAIDVIFEIPNLTPSAKVIVEMELLNNYDGTCTPRLTVKNQSGSILDTADNVPIAIPSGFIDTFAVTARDDQGRTVDQIIIYDSMNECIVLKPRYLYTDGDWKINSVQFSQIV